MHPGERVRIVVETARAVLDGRLDAEAGVQTLLIQEEQIGPHLRSDRIDVTQSEADSVALTLRRLGEQIADQRDTDRSERVPLGNAWLAGLVTVLG